jgi:uncharacterized cofD-like protein
MRFKKKNSLSNPFAKYRDICAIGGGTGLGRLLFALSQLNIKSTGIVATSDNGGSTGWIREHTDSIAWGDIRNCLNQMSPKDCMQGALFQYRFKEFKALESQNLGNLMLYALEQLSSRPLEAINHARELLRIETTLIPMSEHPVHLAAHDEDDMTRFGEVAVDNITSLPHDLWLDPVSVAATPEAVSAIRSADAIILSAGSLLTSVMPNLLLPELLHAITDSKAPVIFIANMAPVDDAVGSMTLDQQCLWMQDILGQNIIDAIIWPASREQHDCEWIETLVADVADRKSQLRHDKDKLIDAISQVLEMF